MSTVPAAASSAPPLFASVRVRIASERVENVARPGQLARVRDAVIRDVCALACCRCYNLLSFWEVTIVVLEADRRRIVTDLLRSKYKGEW